MSLSFKDNPNKDNFVDLFQEINELKTMIIALNNTVSQQNENLNVNDNIITNLKIKLDDVGKELEVIKYNSTYSTYDSVIGGLSYFKNYILPLLSIIGLNYPVFMALGVKYGVTSTMLNYLWYKSL